MVTPNKALIEFHHRFCPDVAISSPELIYQLLEELARIETNRENNEKQNEATKKHNTAKNRGGHR